MNSCFIAALTLVLFNACSEPATCNNVATPALRAHVADASGKAASDVMARARGPKPDDELELNEFGCTFVGGVRDGTYVVSILRGSQQLAA